LSPDAPDRTPFHSIRAKLNLSNGQLAQKDRSSWRSQIGRVLSVPSRFTNEHPAFHSPRKRHLKLKFAPLSLSLRYNRGVWVLGSEHPSTLTSMSNLAFTLKAQSHNDKAISLMEKCLAAHATGKSLPRVRIKRISLSNHTTTSHQMHGALALSGIARDLSTCWEHSYPLEITSQVQNESRHCLANSKLYHL